MPLWKCKIFAFLAHKESRHTTNNNMHSNAHNNKNIAGYTYKKKIIVEVLLHKEKQIVISFSCCEISMRNTVLRSLNFGKPSTTSINLQLETLFFLCLSWDLQDHSRQTWPKTGNETTSFWPGFWLSYKLLCVRVCCCCFFICLWGNSIPPLGSPTSLSSSACISTKGREGEGEGEGRGRVCSSHRRFQSNFFFIRFWPVIPGKRVTWSMKEMGLSKRLLDPVAQRKWKLCVGFPASSPLLPCWSLSFRCRRFWEVDLLS